MKDLFELFLCPAHGLLRVENIQALLAVGNNFILEAGFYLRKVGIL